VTAGTKEKGTYHGRRSGPPGDTAEYWMPRDFNEWEAAWDRHLGTVSEPLAIPAHEGATEQVPVDVEAKAREQEAIAFIRDYTGRFPFILDLRARRAWGTKHYSLSEKQVAAVLRVKANENRPAKVREQTGRDLRVLPVGRTHAAVDNDSGSVTFLIFDRPDTKDRYGNPNKWDGWVFVKQFIGGIGEGQRLGSQRPGETYSGQWANLVDKVLADPMGAVQRFGRELGICGVCSLPLTNDESREFGIGPVCRAKIGGEG
jgi:hypothetical protein